MSTDGDLEAYGEEVRRFCEERKWSQFHTPKDLSIGLTTEASELLELFRFLDERDIQARLDDPRFAERVEDEVGDVVFFLVRLAQVLDIDPLEVARAKLEKSREKYPADEYEGDNWKVLDEET
jgi:NTP pyrophosphatase (non-canonical NTP hydrolase)